MQWGVGGSQWKLCSERSAVLSRPQHWGSLEPPLPPPSHLLCASRWPNPIRSQRTRSLLISIEVSLLLGPRVENGPGGRSPRRGHPSSRGQGKGEDLTDNQEENQPPTRQLQIETCFRHLGCAGVSPAFCRIPMKFSNQIGPLRSFQTPKCIPRYFEEMGASIIKSNEQFQGIATSPANCRVASRENKASDLPRG